MQFKATIHDNGVRDLFQQLHKQTPFATALALTRTGQKIKLNLVTEMRKVFDRPTPYTINSLQLKPAKKTNLIAEVWFKGRWVHANENHYLWPHAYGIQREQKGFEKELYKSGYLTSGRGKYAMPGQGARMDKYGNMSRGQIVQILTALRALRGTPTTLGGGKYKYKLRKGSKDYFSPNYKSSLTPGVYKRQGKSVTPVLIFTHKAVYRKRFAFFEIARKTYEQHYRSEFNAAFNQAGATSGFKGKW